jgi:hypothetical protein
MSFKSARWTRALITVLTLVFMLPFLFSAYGLARADETKARDIMEKVEERDDGDNGSSDMEMILTDKNGKERIRKIRSFMKDMDDDTYRIMFFIHPADVKDTGFLNYDYDDPDKDDDQWLYLPALHKTKRIATSDKSGSFMGSDFTYSDMTSRDIEDYDFELMKETEVNGVKTWQIESVPRSKDVVEETGYTMSIIFVRQDNYVVTRAVHRVKKGSKLKYMDVKKLELIDGIWVATVTHMTTKKGKKSLHKTVLRLQNVSFNQDHDKEMFTVRRLEKGL